MKSHTIVSWDETDNFSAIYILNDALVLTTAHNREMVYNLNGNTFLVIR